MTVTAESLQDAFRYLFPDEVACLKRLAQSLPPDPIVVNIGAGTSGLAFMESRPDVILITIDIEDRNSPFGSLYAEEEVLRRAGFHDAFNRYYPIKGDSKVVAKETVLALVDMVFIDGDHEYSACKGDILGWLPIIKPGGIIAVHDYDKETVYKRADLPAHIPHPLPWRGVTRAVRKYLCPYYPIVEHVDTLIAFRVNEG